MTSLPPLGHSPIALSPDAARHIFQLQPQRTYFHAWIAYAALIILPLLLLPLAAFQPFLGIPPQLTNDQSANAFIASLLWIAVISPIAFFLNGHYFAPYTSGPPIAPHNYLLLKVALWITLSSSTFLSVTLIILSQSIAPHILALLIAYAVLLTQYPSGNALVSHAGPTDNADRYLEPK